MAGIVGVCRLCGQEKKLCKAHVIPESFYGSLVGGDQKLYAFSGSGEIRPPRRPIGAYDPSILCSECDNCFEDSYAHDLLNSIDESAHRVEAPNSPYYEYVSFDYSRLIRFVVSVIWKASISMKMPVSYRRMGDFYECRARDLLLGDDDFLFDYSVVIIRSVKAMDDTLIHHPVLVSKKAAKGINMWYFRTSKFSFFVKVDKREWQLDDFRNLAISPMKPLRIPIMTKEGAAPGVLKMIDNNEKWGVFD